MVTECDFVIAENVGWVDEPYVCENVVPNISFSDMDSVHLKAIISLKNEIL
jgi:hypothetical protein